MEMQVKTEMFESKVNLTDTDEESSDHRVLLAVSRGVQTHSLWRIVVASKESQTDAPKSVQFKIDDVDEQQENFKF